MKTNQNLTGILPWLTLSIILSTFHTWNLAEGRIKAAVSSQRTRITAPNHPQHSLPVKALVAALDTTDTEVRGNAERSLKSIGRLSLNLRNEVIGELLSSIRLKPELDGSHHVLSPQIFAFWESAINIILSLRITQAIDAMITCVHCSNGYAGNMGEPPAFIALVRMGAVAIPKLSQALTQEPNDYKRLRIVGCLSAIGGPKARVALKRALSSETDETVREHIRHALQ